ncbi:MAG: hypothetical protein HYV76_02865 [Candidatus Vogelbacteria bacterium]|nr:hypothetical protein [Candidatus Vogelbacteria bacterium]
MIKKSATKTKTMVLFDAHAILHRAYHALPDFTASNGEPTGALYGLAAMLIKILADLKPDYVAACYDLAVPTFRKQVYDEYKAKRAKTDDDLIAQMERSREVFSAFGVPLYDKPGFEADDIIGTIVEELKGNKAIKVVIASGDMDTMQLVSGEQVQVYTLKKGINDTILYDEAQVVERFGFAPKYLPDYKGLRGDPSDNIIGIAGIGEKTATILIQKFGTIEALYKVLKKDKAVFKELKLTDRIINLLVEGEEEAFFSKTLATIRRDAPIEFKLPDKTWSESFQLEPVEVLFTQLEFKSLLTRVKSLIGGMNSVPFDKAQDQPASATEAGWEEAAIMLWLLNSEKTTPSYADVLEYTKATNLAEAKLVLVDKLKQADLLKVFEQIEVPLMPIIKAAESWGILIDRDHFKQLSKRYHEKLKALETKIYKLAQGEFNINSPKQLGEVLFDRLGLVVKGLKKTAGGARSTRESELIKLKDTHPIINELLEYREVAKLAGTYIDPIPLLADNQNRIHTQLNQAGAATGRMSSQNPGLQNIPTRGERGLEIRRGFVATPGHVWLAVDYSQIEMRVLAQLSGDKALIEIFKNGEDVHSGVASLVFGVKQEEVTKEMRRQAKVINFGIIYGMGVNALRTNLGGTREEAEQFYDNYFRTFPRIKHYFDEVKSDAYRLGYTTTYFGRRRYFAGIKSKLPFIRASAERMAMNAPIQGTAADIIKIAMPRADKALREAGLINQAHLLLQVHDELIYEVEEGVVAKVEPIIREAMEGVWQEAVPLKVDLATGANWAELG